MQVYRGFDTGTAKPPAQARAQVRHHLIDVAEPGEDFSMGEFVRLAGAAIREISHRGNLPVVVGGTGLYIRGLLRGVFEAPRRDERLRARLRAMADRRGDAFLHRTLARVDPPAAVRIAPGDPQRIIRALEVYLLTRRPLSAFFHEEGFGRELYPAVKLGIDLPREELYRRIERRVGRFVREGLFDETRRLLAAGYPESANAFKALGYREAVAAIRGTVTETEAVELIRRNTRRYAKRQLTWFRHETDVVWLDGTTPSGELIDRAEQLARDRFAQMGSPLSGGES
jgi:tRNA dimethylallyltransferase